jgi:hypothetical protein
MQWEKLTAACCAWAYVSWLEVDDAGELDDAGALEPQAAIATAAASAAAAAGIVEAVLNMMQVVAGRPSHECNTTAAKGPREGGRRAVTAL